MSCRSLCLTHYQLTEQRYYKGLQMIYFRKQMTTEKRHFKNKKLKTYLTQSSTIIKKKLELSLIKNQGAKKREKRKTLVIEYIYTHNSTEDMSLSIYIKKDIQ